MLTMILPALLATAQSPTVPPQTTQLPPAPAPIAAPEPPLVEVDSRPYVALVTNLGTITVRLEDRRAPITAANFLKYVDSKRMDGFAFYRSTKSWGGSSLIQAGNRGDPRKNYPPIAHEATNVTGLTNCKGALAMARLAPGDATSDFFLLLTDIKGFDADPEKSGDNAGFAVFGELVGGGEVAEQIFHAPISPTAGQGVMAGQILDPVVTIKSARRVPAPVDAPKGCFAAAS